MAAQSSEEEAAQPNIVPNPSFELYASPPIGWFYKGDHYTMVMKYWSAATIASPDVFGPRVRVPAHWAEKGFGDQHPRTGHSMTGITVFGCESGKPHCREYIQIQLAEQLVQDQDYYVEMWVSHLPRSLQVNNIGFFFSDDKISELTDRELGKQPQINAHKIVEPNNKQWVKISGRFQATSEANYLLIGNFFADNETEFKSICENDLGFGYYYIDDILVKKVPPILPIPIKEDDLSQVDLREGDIIPLKNIYFEFDKAELLPRSYVQLRSLLKIMQENPEMVIEVRGHTDDRGEDGYNFPLSEKRAQAVVDFLSENNIGEHRTRFRGFGSSEPIASNNTPDGRQMNRRVEFLIIQK